MKIFPFNKAGIQGQEISFIRKAIENGNVSGDGEFTTKCNSLFKTKLGVKKSLLTPSCTHALEMAAILLDIKQGDEVIVPSFTFVSTINAFVLRGAKPVFIDILSLEKYKNGEMWKAQSQFGREFLNPLVYSFYSGLPFNNIYKGNLNGVSNEEVLKVISFFRKFNR